MSSIRARVRQSVEDTRPNLTRSEMRERLDSRYALAKTSSK
jgi:hypothetical protein